MPGTDKVSCLSHKPNSHFFVMYEDFLCIAKVSEHRYKLAAFWRVLETKTNDRIIYNQELIEEAKKKGLPEPETNLWIEIPYSEFVNRSLGVYKSSSFQVASAESERLGFSQSRNLKRPKNLLDPDSPLEDYKEYFFQTEVMQTAITTGILPPPIEINSPLLKSISTRKEKKKAKRAIENNSTPLLKSTPPAIEINRINNITEESLKNNEIDYVSADAERTPASSEIDQEQAETLKALQAGLTQSGVIAEYPIATTDTPTTLLQAEQERDMHNGHGNAHHHGASDTGGGATLLPLVPMDGDTSAAGTQPAQEVIPIGVDKSQANGDKSNGKRKPPKPKDETLEKRIDAVYAALDTFKQEVMDDPDTKFRRTKIGNEEITELLVLNPTLLKLRKVFYDMWNEKDQKTGEHFWRKRMSPQNVCKHYEARLMGLEGKEKKPDKKQEQDIVLNALINSPTINGTRNLAYEMDMMEKKFLENKSRKRA